jgi:hypothetical protein
VWVRVPPPLLEKVADLQVKQRRKKGLDVVVEPRWQQ